MERHMEALSGNFEIKTIADAPLGNTVYQVCKGAWLQTERIPCDITENYLVFGYLRWLGDGLPGTYYATVFAYDAEGKVIPGDGSYWHYHHNGQELPSNKWVKIKFIVGPNGKPHSPTTKFISVGAGVNYTQGTGTIQYCGWSVRMLN
eukprot:TRINITY_DN12013_c0_g1_i1.p1 TRINITY_DN12013_c0_g1~~TRINITY_DN12013_c0_g1_i1.p1  ORF type:complete len:148 (-),score=3.11 TRINITY_DN12013_c0_g1_i1:30-473(-)